MPPFKKDPPPTSPQSFPIRTAKKHGKQPIQQAPSIDSSSQQPQSDYPKRIHPDKQPKALELYVNLKMAELLDQTTATEHDGYHLDVPGPSRARSVTSQGSSPHQGAPSTTASQSEAMTDYSSVLSFNPSQSSANVEGFVSFTGEQVRPRTRRPLNPTQKAKAALVRHLGSCGKCRSRRVPCPLKHHDIECLERLRLDQEQSEPQRPLSATSSTSQRTARSITKQEPASDNSMSDTLRGFGAGLPEIKMDLDGDIDILSGTSGGGYGNTQTETPAPAVLNPVAPNLPLVNPDPYALFTHGALFLIGVFRNQAFYCQHFQVCPQPFASSEELQVHFETSHFYFTRINPAIRYICSACKVMGNPNQTCPCGAQNCFEMFICGNFIKTPWFQRHAPDGADFQSYSSGPSFGPTGYGSGGSSGNIPWDPNMNRGGFGGFGGGSNQGQYNHQSGHGYGHTVNQGGGWGASNGSGSGSGQYRGTYGTRQMACDNKGQVFGSERRLELVLLVLFFLVLAFGFGQDWFTTGAGTAAACMSSQLPTLGFGILMASIAIPMLSAKYFTGRRPHVDIPLLVEQLAKKMEHADGELHRELSVLGSLLHTVLSRLDSGDWEMDLCVVKVKSRDPKNDFMFTPAMKHGGRHYGGMNDGLRSL